MSMGKTLKQAVKSGFKRLGLNVRRVPVRIGIKITRATSNESDSDHDLPPLLNDPLEALHYTQGGKTAAFRCPLDRMGAATGLKFAQWNPFVETLHEYRAGHRTYQGSTLERYYENWQPGSAAEALIGFDNAPEALSNAPSYALSTLPWRSLTVEEVIQHVRGWSRSDNSEHGLEDFQIDVHGYKAHGPVSRKKGQLEYERTTSIYESIKRDGYDRREGHVQIWLLKRGDDYLFINRGGYHRSVAMEALGYDAVPAVFKVPCVFDVKEARYWPQVRRGIWTKKQAISYVDHLFNFDPRKWARDRGLLQTNESNST